MDIQYYLDRILARRTCLNVEQKKNLWDTCYAFNHINQEPLPMKKPLILFLVLLVALFSVFASVEVDKVEKNAAISQNTGYAPAVPEGVTKITRKRSVKWQVNYVYQVNGASYKIDSPNMSEEAAKVAANALTEQVAYNTKLPSQALLKSDFDHRDLSETKAGAMLTAAGIALGVSLLLTLILSWKFGWLRRKA
jgi:hypothetical protein